MRGVVSCTRDADGGSYGRGRYHLCFAQFPPYYMYRVRWLENPSPVGFPRPALPDAHGPLSWRFVVSEYRHHTLGCGIQPGTSPIMGSHLLTLPTVGNGLFRRPCSTLAFVFFLSRVSDVLSPFSNHFPFPSPPYLLPPPPF